MTVTNVWAIPGTGNTYAAFGFCSVEAIVVAVIVACVPRPASVAAVTEMVYSVPALRPWKV